MVINSILCGGVSESTDEKYTRAGLPSSMYEGCLKVATWTSANRYFANSLSGTFIRACNRFFVSTNFSPYGNNEGKHNNKSVALKNKLTGMTTNLKGTPCVLVTSFEKWKTLMILTVSSASNSSRGTSSA